MWWTLRRPFRALSYDAARAMFTRANAALGANWSLHDLRHTAAYRMARDPQMPLTDVQWVLGHAHLSTTQRYLNPVTEDVIAGVLAFHARHATATRRRRRRRDTGPESLQILFGEDDVVTADADRRRCTGDRPRRPCRRRPASGAGEADRGAAAGRVPAPPGRARRGRRPRPSRAAVLARVLAAPFALDNPAQPADPPAGGAGRAELAADPARRQLAAAVAGQRRRGPARLAGPDHRCGRRSAPAADGAGTQLPHLGPGLLVLICADVIRPSLGWLLRFAPARRGLAAEMARTRDTAAFAALDRVVHARAGSGCRPGSRR